MLSRVNRFVFGALLIAVSLAATPEFAHAKCAQYSAMISGTVLDYSLDYKKKRAYIKDAEVYVFLNDNVLREKSIQTNSDGSFETYEPLFVSDADGCRVPEILEVTVFVLKPDYYPMRITYKRQASKAGDKMIVEGYSVTLSPVRLYTIKP